MNSIFSLVSSESIINTYISIKNKLSGYDLIIFSAMKKVDNRFIEPTHPSQYSDKHKEIESRLEYVDMINGHKTVFRLFEEIWQSCNNSSLPLVPAIDILNLTKIQTNNSDIFIRLTDDARWVISTRIFCMPSTESEIRLEQIDNGKGWEEIVPQYIVEYILNAIYAYKQGMFMVTAALLSIAMEGTLRDVLATKGYAFNQLGSKFDTYHYADASIAVNGSDYVITFKDTLPKQPADLVSSGNSPMDIKIKRVIKQRGRRIDLNILCPSDLLDHWSKDTIEQQGNKTIGGLGEALIIARDVEHILTPIDLPIDFDNVITGVRNNLIHLSGGSFNQTIRILGITLEDFLRDDKKVHLLVTKVSRFINNQYIQIKNNTP